MPRRTKADSEVAHPFVKWAGGKAQLLDELLAQVPEKLGTYHEPFVGGGALFFRLKSLGRIKKARLSDANPDLMTAYRALRDFPDAVIEELERVQGQTSEAEYYAMRAQDPDGMTAPQRTARFIYLNRMGFNGLYRVNSKGRFNVPYGRYKDPKILDRENLRMVSLALQGISVDQASFGGVLKAAKAGDFVYFDPPYLPVSRTANFTAYSKSGFGDAEQRQLATVAAALADQGVEVLLSNSDTPFARELYEGHGFEVSRVEAVRAINSKATGRGAVGELLVRAHARGPSPREGASDGQLSIDFGK
jgi:DNA adenine methylase